MSVVIDVARREWEDGYRRFQVALFEFTTR